MRVLKNFVQFDIQQLFAIFVRIVYNIIDYLLTGKSPSIGDHL